MMWLTATILSLFSLYLINCDEVDWSEYFDYSTYINEPNTFKLYWKDTHIDINNKSNDLIEFGMEVESTGWIAMGISPNGGMPNSDIMLGWVDNNGTAYLYDMHTKTERVTPFIDDHNDLTLNYGEEVNGITRIRFSRPKYLCNDQDLKIEIGTTRILYAMNDEDPDNTSFPESLLQHTLFGRQSLNLDVGYQTSYDEALVADDPSIMIADITMENHIVAAEETNYFCQLFELPQLDEMHHIVKFEPWITEGNEAIVHHLNLFHCPASKVNLSHIGHGADCETWGIEENMPAQACIGFSYEERETTAIHVVYAWAVGMKNSVLPENVGAELGGVGDDALRYGMLEMHYDNPGLIEGIVDHSGFRMYYTPNLREMSAGMLTIGHYYDERHFVPEGMTTVNYGYCMSDCTGAENAFPPDGIKVFGTFLHGHPINTALNLRHVRDGEELKPIVSDWAYDFDYQQMVAIDNTVILPGDDLILECFETNYRNRTTFGGIRTSTEMCLAFLWVYPKPDLLTCATTFTENDLLSFETRAKSAGYLNEEATLVNYHDKTPFDYDITMEGAVDFYNNLWVRHDGPYGDLYTERYLMCLDGNGDSIWHDGSTYVDHIGEIPEITHPLNQNENQLCYNEFTEYADDTAQKDDLDTDVIIGIVVAAVVVLLIIIGLGILYCMRRKKNGENKSTENKTYKKVTSAAMNENATENTEDAALTV